jgi:eukaryotic-like serine/threonine-protein kinase
MSGTRYEIVDTIARGGMGVVFVGRDRELAREVAIKVLSLDASAGDAAARMEREARILARLEHPGIVPVHDVGRLPDGRVFYVMKLVRGPRLDEHMARTPVLAERLRIFERICDAVSFAHARGIIHRDLKPANIMVGPFGEVLVLDWGVARVPFVADSVDGAAVAEALSSPADPAAHTAHGTVLGTPGYMAPEQARGDVRLIDERTDVHALGAILRFLLDGGGPESTESSRIVPGDSSARRRGAAAVEAICCKAMAEAPESRYRTVSDLSADVARFLDGVSVGAYREPMLETARRIVRAYRTPILLVLAYLLIRMLLLIFAGA